MKEHKLSYVGRPVELKIKRLRLPVVLDVECEKCEHKFGHDLEEDYLSYPVIGENIICSGECPECSEEYEEIIQIEMNIIHRKKEIL